MICVAAMKTSHNNRPANAATNGLASGTVWSDGGTLKVMP